MSTETTPARIVISADDGLGDRWTAERQARQVTSSQLLTLALDALTSTDGAGGARVRHLERQLADERARSATLRDELTSARTHARALQDQLQREADDAIDLTAPIAPTLEALWQATHLPQLLLWRDGEEGDWLSDDRIPAHHRLVIHAARQRLAQLEAAPSASAALNFSRVVQSDLSPLLMSESGLLRGMMPYQSPMHALTDLPRQVAAAVILARKLRGLDPETDPYGLPVGQGHLDAIDRADQMSRERRAREQPSG
jgi:hypothetical protein